MTRRHVGIGVAIGVTAVALGWALMAAVSRALRVNDQPTVSTTASTATESRTAVPRIKVTLYFVSEDGRGLSPVEREIALAEGVVGQARAVVDAQLTAKPDPPLVSAIPEGVTLRGVFVSSRNEVFVDLDTTVRDKHPGGSLNELLTVYTIVNAVTTNLRDIQGVQVLIDGREVDTLAGHVDLRRPLRKNDELVKR